MDLSKPNAILVSFTSKELVVTFHFSRECVYPSIVYRSCKGRNEGM